MSLKTKLIKFDEKYLNGLHADKQNSLDDDDLKCYTCRQPFQRGEWFISSFRRNKYTGKYAKRHVRCALRINLITKTDLKELQKYRSAGFALILAVWIMSTIQIAFR